MLHRTEGIVLRTIPFGDADLIVTYITPDLGLLKVFAKSPRKIKSRFGSSLEPLTQSRISFWGRENTSLPRLTQSDIICSFHSIRESLHRFLMVSEMLELTLCFLPERDVNSNAYSLLLNTLNDFKNGQNENLLLTHYKIKFLKLAGFAPKLDSCGRCGRKGQRFYLSHGSILCETCTDSTDSPIIISAAAIKLYDNLLNWDATKITRIKPSERLLSELEEILKMHVIYVLSNPLNCNSLNQSFK